MLSPLHEFPNDTPPDAVPAQAITNYQQEKAVAQSFKDWQAGSKSATEAYQRFATDCHCLWLRYKSQGGRKGNTGFKRVLKRLSIPERIAYKAMWSAFPMDRPTSRRTAAKLLPPQRLHLKELKSRKGDGAAFQSELRSQLQAIANSVAERYDVDVLFTVTLQQGPKS